MGGELSGFVGLPVDEPGVPKTGCKQQDVGTDHPFGDDVIFPKSFHVSRQAFGVD